MSDRFFLDTNIIIYSFDDGNPAKQKVARELIEKGLEGHNGCISYQVVQEFANVATRKFAVPMSHDDCRHFIEIILSPMWEVYASRDLVSSALDLAERWQYSFYDALIIAAALEASCNILYSEDLQHRQKIYQLQIIDPFA
ncbi:MAG: PIN domain-containing protein [Balneolaceae bacterium]|nr:MAG: PIN domain-containing protein [Balneolaceae bacterium]